MRRSVQRLVPVNTGGRFPLGMEVPTLSPVPHMGQRPAPVLPDPPNPSPVAKESICLPLLVCLSNTHFTGHPFWAARCWAPGI